MIDHATFSALRLRHLFPPEHLEAYATYFERQDPERRCFDEEYMGGQYDSELIDGVQLWFPRAGRGQVGIVELSASRYADAFVQAGTPVAFIDAAWAANANRVLEALGLPVRMGAGAAAVRALAAGRVHQGDFSDGTRSFLSFACRAPDVYHVQAVVHAADGLLRLAVRRPDLVRANDPEGGYDLCFGGLHDEGT